MNQLKLGLVGNKCTVLLFLVEYLLNFVSFPDLTQDIVAINRKTLQIEGW